MGTMRLFFDSGPVGQKIQMVSSYAAGTSGGGGILSRLAGLLILFHSALRALIASR